MQGFCCDNFIFIHLLKEFLFLFYFYLGMKIRLVTKSYVLMLRKYMTFTTCYHIALFLPKLLTILYTRASRVFLYKEEKVTQFQPLPMRTLNDMYKHFRYGFVKVFVLLALLVTVLS